MRYELKTETDFLIIRDGVTDIPYICSAICSFLLVCSIQSRLSELKPPKDTTALLEHNIIRTYSSIY